jgi:hypothetical protein
MVKSAECSEFIDALLEVCLKLRSSSERRYSTNQKCSVSASYGRENMSGSNAI